MQVLSKLLEQIEFNRGPKIEEHMLIVIVKSTHEARLCQPLETKNRQFDLGITFPTGYNGSFFCY